MFHFLSTREKKRHPKRVAADLAKRGIRFLDAPVEIMGAMNLPAVPLNMGLEAAMLPNEFKVTEKISAILGY